VIVVAIVLARPGLRAGTVDFVRDLRGGRFPWILTLGGLGGATFVLGQGLVVGVLGVSLYIVCVVAGQTVTGLVVDRLGIGPGGVRPLTWPRVIGAGLMVVSVVLAMSGGIRTDVPAVLLVLPVVAGIAMGLQQAFNGRVTQHTGKFMVATLGNFVVGTTALVVAAILHALVVGHGPGRLPAEPVLYLGGAIGVAFIAMAAYLAGPLGVLTLAMSTIAGQIVGSVVLDLLIPAADAHVGILTLLGAALTLIAALVTAGMRIRRGPRSHGTAAG
jgi:transporter family-2 protein